MTDALNARIATARLWNGVPLSGDALGVGDFRTLLESRAGDDALLYAFYSGGRNLVRRTFAEYVADVRTLAHRLYEDFGVRAGHRILVAYDNRPEALIVFGALLALGATIVSVNPAEHEDHVDFVVEDCACRGMIAASGTSAPRHRDKFFRLSFDAAGTWETPDGFPGPHPTSDTEALVVYTSGTTGRSKGVALDQGNLLANAEGVRRMHRIGPAHVHMCILPLFHVNAFNFSFVGTLYCGARLILCRNFYLPAFWRIVADERVQVVSAVPLALRTLLNDPRAPKRSAVPRDLAYFTSAAAPLSADLMQRFLDRFGRRIAQSYGLSETVNFNLITDPALDDASYRKVNFSGQRPTSGCAVWGNEVAVLDAEGRYLPDGETGEIAARGWNVMRGYIGDDRANAAAFAHGWFRTGDLGHAVTHGHRRFFYVTGRKKETIKRKGETVAPLEIEETLQRHAPNLPDCAVVGFDNSHAGEEIGVALVAPRDPDAEASILAICGELFPALRRPRAVAFVAEIPRTSTGKIRREELKAEFAHLYDTDLDRRASPRGDRIDAARSKRSADAHDRCA